MLGIISLLLVICEVVTLSNIDSATEEINILVLLMVSESSQLQVFFLNMCHLA